MTLLDIPDDLIVDRSDDGIAYEFNLIIFIDADRLRLKVGDVETSWIGCGDSFLERVRFGNLNPCFLEKHVTKEIETKNALTQASLLLENEKPSRAIELLDMVIRYDPDYSEALFLKSKALFLQGHFVKSLRHYRKAVRVDSSLEDVEYYKLLLKRASAERDDFPKIKRNIYAGDEHFARRDYENALQSYERALVNPSKFKEKILYKLLNKKASALLKLERPDEAYECFSESLGVFESDFAYFGAAVSLHRSGGDSKVIVECLQKSQKLTKGQLVKKALILDSIGEYEMCLLATDEFLESYFRVDDDYLTVLELKRDVLKSLGKDTEKVEKMIHRLN